MVGAGSIAAGLTSAPLIRRHGEPTLLALGVANGSVGYLLLSPGQLPVVLIGAVVKGFALPWAVIALINLSQRLTPVDLQGRVAAAIGLLLFAPQPIAHLLGAAAITTIAFSVIFLTVSAVSAVNLGLVLLHRRARSSQLGWR